jgi:hypothetical protein
LDANLDIRTAAMEGLEERDATEAVGSTAASVPRVCRRGVTDRDGGDAVLKVETDAVRNSGDTRGADGHDIAAATGALPCSTGADVSKGGPGGTLKHSLGTGAAKYFGSKVHDDEALEPPSMLDDANSSLVLELLR